MHPWQSGATTMTQYSDHHTAPAPPSIDGPAVSADEVGAAFAFQYFKIMKTRPDDLFRFYNNESKVSRGMPSSNGTVDVRHAIGPSRIRELLRKEHSCGTRLALAIINNIEAQESSAGAVIVQITGTLKFVDDTERDFVMTAFLVQQDTSSSSGYYVLNDILIFQQLQDNSTQVAVEKPQRISKPNFNQQHETHLTQEAPDPVTAPVAASAQPAAAPLPTTTAPQLSGATNTPTAAAMHEETSFATPASPAVSAHKCEAVTEQLVEEPLPVESGQEKEQEKVEEKQKEEDREEKHEERAMVENTELAKPEKKNVWKKPATSVGAPDGFDEIVVTPTKRSKNPQTSGKSTDSTSSSTTPFNPVDASRYSETSYAAKVLQHGPGGLRAPCQIGFAVPPVNDNVKPSDERRRPNQSKPNNNRGGPRQGRGKTLWVSVIPAEMTDENVMAAVAEQLKANNCEGQVIRIERIPSQQHGYLELDTELCAKLILEKGLQFNGRSVIVDFPNKGRRGQGDLERGPRRSSEEGEGRNMQRRGPPRNSEDGEGQNGHRRGPPRNFVGDGQNGNRRGPPRNNEDGEGQNGHRRGPPRNFVDGDGQNGHRRGPPRNTEDGEGQNVHRRGPPRNTNEDGEVHRRSPFRREGAPLTNGHHVNNISGQNEITEEGWTSASRRRPQQQRREPQTGGQSENHFKRGGPRRPPPTQNRRNPSTPDA